MLAMLTGFFGTIPSTTAYTTASTTTTQPTTSTTASTSTLTTTTVSPPPVEVKIKPTGATSPEMCNDLTAGYGVYYSTFNATFNIAPGIPGCFNITATNITATSSTLPNSNNIIVAINYTFSNSNVSSNITMHYPCNIPASNVAPFILRNGTWQKITPFTVDSAVCTVTYEAPSDPIIALFVSNSTSANTTTQATTSEVTTVQQPSPQQSNQYILPAIAIIIILAIIAFRIYLRNRR